MLCKLQGVGYVLTLVFSLFVVCSRSACLYSSLGWCLILRGLGVEKHHG
jgi:hypothetical protein